MIKNYGESITRIMQELPGFMELNIIDANCSIEGVTQQIRDKIRDKMCDKYHNRSSF